MSFLEKSNRVRHFWAGAFIGFFLTIIFAFIAGVYKEVKDKSNGGKFDFLDILSTVFGGAVGSIWPAVAVLIYYKENWILALTFYIATPLFIFIFWGLFEGFGTLISKIKSLFV